MPDLKKMLTLEALSEALPSWLKRATKPEYNADEIDSTLTTNQFVTATDKENWNAKGTYSKPSGGIPKSDLSSIVQTSLEKADSALQSETDPTVPSWAKQTNKPSYTQDEVADGSTYKRVTQTEKNTWNGKQNALTTTQMQAVNSGITSEKVTQISTNQTNILYALNRTGKNLLRELPTQTINGVTLTNNGDGTYTITRTATSTSPASFIFGNNDNGRLTGCKMTGGASGYGLKSRTSSGAPVDISTNWTTAVTISATAVGNITVNVESSENPQNVQIRPFVCDAEMYAKDPSFTKPALPNYDLTRLEAEDRASLAEVVDSGAKNLLDFANVIMSAYSVTQTKTDTTLTVTGATSHYGNVKFGLPNVSTAGYYVISFRVTAATKASGTRIMAQVYSNAGASGSPIIDTQITGTGNYQLEMNFAANTSYYLFIYPSRDSAQSSNSVTITDFMVCTKAAFCLSPKFVPYRLPNNNLGYKTYVINLSAVTISKAGSGVYWYKISVSSDFSKVVSVSLTDGKEIPNKRSFMPYIENGTGGAQAIGFLIADPDAPATMTFNDGAYMSLTAFGYLK